MNLNSMAVFCLLAMSLVLPLPAQAQGTNLPSEEEADVAIQDNAIEALNKMAAHLRTLERFRLTANVTRDDVLDDGLKAQIGATLTYDVIVPSKLKLDLQSDEQWRIYYYDGSTVTQYAPTLDLYAVFDAAPTIAETVDLADEKYGVQLPLADLFFWGTPRSNVEGLSVAYFVGEARIDGQTCDHYAYRAEGADFQVWISKHGDPLPCKIVITTTDDPARPEYEATLHWDVEPLLTDSMFSFAPPAGVTKIEQQQVANSN